MACKCKRKIKPRMHENWTAAVVLILWWIGVWGLIETGLSWAEATYAQRALVYVLLMFVATMYTVKMGHGVLSL